MEDEIILDINKVNPTRFYYRNESVLRFFTICCRKSKKEMLEANIINQGVGELEFDFNFKNYMERCRKCDYESSEHLHKKNVNYKSYTDKEILMIDKICPHDYEDYLKNFG